MILTQVTILMSCSLIILLLFKDQGLSPRNFSASMDQYDSRVLAYLSTLPALTVIGNLYLVIVPSALTVPRRVNEILYTAVGVIAVSIFLRMINRDKLYFSIPVFSIVILQILAAINDLDNLTDTVSIMNPFLLLPLLFTSKIGNQKLILQILAFRTLLIWTTYLILAIAINPERVILPCRLDKCGILNSRISESLQGNVLGIVFAICIAMLMDRPSKIIWFIQWMVLTFIALTVGGRASIFSLLVVLILNVFSVFPKHKPFIKKVELRVLAMMSLIFAAIFPFTIGKLQVFKDRKILWDLAISMLETNWFFGYGPDYWSTTTSYSGQFTYSPHNFILAILISGGFFALVITIGVLAIPIFSKSFSVQDTFLRVLILLSLNGALESGFNSVGIGTMQFIFIFLLFATVQRTRDV